MSRISPFIPVCFIYILYLSDMSLHINLCQLIVRIRTVNVDLFMCMSRTAGTSSLLVLVWERSSTERRTCCVLLSLSSRWRQTAVRLKTNGHDCVHVRFLLLISVFKQWLYSIFNSSIIQTTSLSLTNSSSPTQWFPVKSRNHLKPCPRCQAALRPASSLRSFSVSWRSCDQHTSLQVQHKEVTFRIIILFVALQITVWIKIIITASWFGWSQT